MFQQSGQQRAGGGPPTGIEIAKFGTYAEAQRAVDYLADKEFPVGNVTIVGSDLISVERVIAKLSYGKVAGAGLASGAWMGLFVGLLFGIFAPAGAYLATIAPAVAIGAGFGILFAVVSYAMSKGQRDFASTSAVMARTYTILARAEVAGDATQLLAQLPGGSGAHRQPEPQERSLVGSEVSDPEPTETAPRAPVEHDPQRTNPYRQPDL